MRAEIQEVSHKFPNEILVGLNDRDPQLHDIWRINIETGEKKLVQQNPGVAGYLTDDDFNVRLAINYTPTGGQVWQVAGRRRRRQQVERLPRIRSRRRDDQRPGRLRQDRPDALLRGQPQPQHGRPVRDGPRRRATSKLIADDPRTDVGGVLAHPTEKNIQAVSFTYAPHRVEGPRRRRSPPTSSFSRTFQDGDFIVTSRTLDDTQWTVAYILDDGPVKFYRYVRDAGAEGERSCSTIATTWTTTRS